MKKSLKILLLEDNPSDAGLVKRELKQAHIDFEMKVVDNREGFKKGLSEFKPDLILSDHALPSFNSMEALDIVKEHQLDIPFIIVSGSVSDEFAVKLMRAGVTDYVVKNSLTRLPSAIENIFANKEIKREIEIMGALHQKLKFTYQEIEEKNKSITDSIIYAKRIQEAMLPAKAVITKPYPESFILYKPKDIVSGDYYWFGELNGQNIVAVADCTGHGVPGAFMSMIGHNLLNSIIHTKKVSDPAEILKLMNKGIHRILKQDEEGTPSFDGMDIAIVAIDKARKKIRFAGANSPLYYMRNEEIEIIHGDAYGVGGAHLKSVMKYTALEFSYRKGDSIYLATDGYADQFGGDKGKKLMRKNFLKLLTAIQPFNMPDQGKHMNQWFEEWKGNMDQTDDTLLMGIRF